MAYRVACHYVVVKSAQAAQARPRSPGGGESGVREFLGGSFGNRPWKQEGPNVFRPASALVSGEKKAIGMRWLSGLLCAVSLTLALHAAEELPERAYGILKKNCFACHGQSKASGLDLRTRESMLKGGQRGPALTPANPKRSFLFSMASHSAQPSMPPGKKLADDDIEVLRQWIEKGAELTGIETQPLATGGEQKFAERPITKQEREFWAFRKPVRSTPPAVADSAWNRNPIDAFLRKAMADRKLEPSRPANRRTLVRRAYLDLLGMPPTPEEVEAFVVDKSPGAWEKLVDKLLNSPQYGERWTRHWLDLVRYADSGGFEFDVDRPEAWRYRDYVVRAFNNDKPYDLLLKEHLAGDEYAPDSADAMIATGYLQLGAENGGGARARQDSIDDIIGTTSLAFLGVTVGCARCHDHKFDPIPQKDYYRMQAVFFSIKEVKFPLVGTEMVAAHEAEIKRIQALQKPLREAKTTLEKPHRLHLMDAYIQTLADYLQTAWRAPERERSEGQKLNVLQIEKTLQSDTLANRISEAQIAGRMSLEEKARHSELKAKIAALDSQKPKPYATAMAIGEDGREPKPAYFLHRGGVEAKGPRMTAGVLSVATESEHEFAKPPANAKSSWQRRGFAEWVASPENPLTARVMVNRLWQHHFGEGIVRTPSNFGKLGDLPTHPELLDWLATEFVARGWSMKSMHRLLMTSQAYRMSSDDNSGGMAGDPENKLLWRMPRVRLEAEAIRDSILAAAGSLDLTLGGPCVYPYINPELFQSSTGRTWPGKPEEDPSTWRRSLYVFSKRSIRYPLFEAYDQPNLVNSCDRRNRSIVAPQALFLMNDSFVILQAKRFAERLRKEAGDDPRKQIERAYRVALGRLPAEPERAMAMAYVKDSTDGLAGFCQALFSLNEFVYRP